MVSARLSPSPAKNGSRVTLRFGRHAYQLDLEEAIVLTHSLINAKQYEVASRICGALVRGGVHDPRVQILLAVSKAGLEDYRECNRIIQAVFQEEDGRVNRRLHAAIDHRGLATRRDAMRALKAMPEKGHDLVTICTLLGDLLVSLGEHKKAALCWRLALQSAGATGPFDLDAPDLTSVKLHGSPTSPRRNHHRRQT
jgi:hypothetical protein